MQRLNSTVQHGLPVFAPSSLSRPPSLIKLLHDDPAARALPLNHCAATAQPQNNLIDLVLVALRGMLCLALSCLWPLVTTHTPWLSSVSP